MTLDGVLRVLGSVFQRLRRNGLEVLEEADWVRGRDACRHEGDDEPDRDDPRDPSDPCGSPLKRDGDEAEDEKGDHARDNADAKDEREGDMPLALGRRPGMVDEESRLTMQAMPPAAPAAASRIASMVRVRGTSAKSASAPSAAVTIPPREEMRCRGRRPGTGRGASARARRTSGAAETASRSRSGTERATKIARPFQ